MTLFVVYVFCWRSNPTNRNMCTVYIYMHILVAFIIIYKDLNGPLTHKSGGIYICPARCDFLFVSNCKFDKFPRWSFQPTPHQIVPIFQLCGWIRSKWTGRGRAAGPLHPTGRSAPRCGGGGDGGKAGREWSAHGAGLRGIPTPNHQPLVKCLTCLALPNAFCSDSPF